MSFSETEKRGRKPGAQGAGRVRCGRGTRLAETHGETISLILTDVMIPGMSGWKMSERILSSYPKIKLVFMSGYASGIISPNGIVAEGITLFQ